MANPNRPYGFVPCNSNGGTYTGQINRYFIPATDAVITAVGDLVTSAGSADADGIPTVVRSTAGDDVRGVVVGFDWQDGTYENLPNYRPASVAAYVLVADDPNLFVRAQEDSDTSTIAATDIGNNVNFIVANANSTTGRSQMEIDSNTVNTTITLPLKLIQLYQNNDNVIGDNAQYICSFNTHDLKASSGSTGV